MKLPDVVTLPSFLPADFYALFASGTTNRSTECDRPGIFIRETTVKQPGGEGIC
jgi:hypothetical protein